MDFERDTLTAVMDARAKALTATGPADAAQKEGQLTQALGRLLAVAENYPTLKSNDNVKMLQEELSATENKVGFARQFYNDIATKFNTAQQVFPTNIFAGIARLQAGRAVRDHRRRPSATCRPSICPDTEWHEHRATRPGSLLIAVDHEPLRAAGRRIAARRG